MSSAVRSSRLIDDESIDAAFDLAIDELISRYEIDATGSLISASASGQLPHGVGGPLRWSSEGTVARAGKQTRPRAAPAATTAPGETLGGVAPPTPSASSISQAPTTSDALAAPVVRTANRPTPASPLLLPSSFTGASPVVRLVKHRGSEDAEIAVTGDPATSQTDTNPHSPLYFKRSASFVEVPTHVVDSVAGGGPPAAAAGQRSGVMPSRCVSRLPVRRGPLTGIAAIAAQIRHDAHYTRTVLESAFSGTLDLSVYRAARVVSISNESIHSLLEQYAATLHLRLHKPSTTSSNVDVHHFSALNVVREVVAGTIPDRFGITEAALRAVHADDVQILQARRGELRRGFTTRGLNFAGECPMAITFAPLVAPWEFDDSVTHATTPGRIAGVNARCVLVGTLVHEPSRARAARLPQRRPQRGGVGVPTLTPWHAPPTATTVSAKRAFAEQRRKETRARVDAEKPKLALWQKMVVYGDASEYALAMQLKQREEEDARRAHMVAELAGSGRFEGEREERVEGVDDGLLHFLQSHQRARAPVEGAGAGAGSGSGFDAPHEGGPQEKGRTAEKEEEGPDKSKGGAAQQHSPPIASLLESKTRAESAPLRRHPELCERRFSDFVPYRECTFTPSFLVVFETPSVDCDASLRGLTSSASLRSASRVSSEASVKAGRRFSPLDFTTRWGCLIEDLRRLLPGDSFVRSMVEFGTQPAPAAATAAAAVHSRCGTTSCALTTAPLPLPQVLNVCEHGAASIDVKAMNDAVYYRHSFVFSTRYCE